MRVAHFFADNHLNNVLGHHLALCVTVACQVLQHLETNLAQLLVLSHPEHEFFTEVCERGHPSQ